MTRNDAEQRSLISPPPRLTRRSLLARLIEASSVFTLALKADGSERLFVDAGPVTAFEPGATTRVVLPVTFNQEVIYVVASEKQSWTAYSARCTHKGCVVAWEDNDHAFLCPCHGGRFDAQGVPVAGPPPVPLRRLATRLSHGRLLIEAPPLINSSDD